LGRLVGSAAPISARDGLLADRDSQACSVKPSERPIFAELENMPWAAALSEAQHIHF
jgi:hypothetical protein